MSFRILFVFYRNTKISGISDKAKSLATFCCSGVSKNIKYSVAEFKYNKMCMKKIIIIILCLSLSSLSFAQVFDIQSNLNRAENGDIEAAAKVGLAYYFQHKDVEAFKWLKIAGEKGYSTVYSLLGMMYHTGRGVAQNDQEALIWSKKAAENGDPQGWYLYGLMKGLGQGSPVDYPTSLFYLKKAAESGISDACMGVGHIYFYGKGVDEAAAFVLAEFSCRINLLPLFHTDIIVVVAFHEWCTHSEIGDTLLGVVLGDALPKSVNAFRADHQLVLPVNSCDGKLHIYANYMI